MSVSILEKENFSIIKVEEKVFIRKQSKLFLKEVEALRAKGVCNFIIDFSTCDYVSSEGLGVFAEMWHWANEQKNGLLTICLSDDPNNELKYLLDITGLGLLMKSNICFSIDSAEEMLLKLIKDQEELEKKNSN